MKKIVFISMISLFMSCVPVAAWAVTPTTIPLTIAPTNSQELPIISQANEYVLPFPGMLPDHPLYTLKVIRDSILEKLIVDPTRKTEFYILQADKRLQMGTMLIAKGNLTLGESTVSKGEKYLHKAVQTIRDSKSIGVGMPPYVLERAEKSLNKHEEIVLRLIEQSTGNTRTGFSGSYDLIKTLQNEITTLK